MRVYLILFFMLFSIQAKDYYVAQDGNNGNDGSKNKPLQTIFRALNLANSPGDNIIIRAGTYRPPQTINIPNSGSKGRLITLKAEEGEKVIIDGSNLKPNANLIAVLGSYFRIEGITVQNSKGNGITVFGPGSRTNNVEILNNILHSNFKSGLIISCQNQQDPVRDVIAEGNTIYNNSLMNKVRAQRPAWSVALSTGIAKNVIFKNNRVYENYGEGLGGYLSDNLTIEGNTVYDNFSVNLYLDNTTNSLVSRNLVYSSGNKEFFRFNQPANGIQIANETYPNFKNPSKNNKIINNIVVGTRVGFYVANYQEGGGLVESSFINNTISKSILSALSIDPDKGHRNSFIANNIFQHDNNRIAVLGGNTSQIQFSNNFWSQSAPANVRGTGDKTGDPLFLNPREIKAENFKLNTGSRAIDSGSSKFKILIDYSGNKRSVRIDIGAWEIR